MKISLLLCFIFIYSCGSSVVKPELTRTEKEQLQLKFTERKLNHYKEKIVLLSAIKGVPYDTLYLILRDYYSQMDYLGNDDGNTLKNALTYTSEKHNLAKPKIASIIFSFKYEMLTQEEIIESQMPTGGAEE